MFKRNTTHQRISFSGRVCGIFNGGISEKGVEYGRIPVQDLKTGDIYIVTCFREMTQTLKKLEISEKVSVHGKKDPVENNIVADAIATDTGKRTVYESPAVKRDRHAKAKEYFLRYDMVPSVIFDEQNGQELTIWSARSDCVLMPDGRYKLKIEFLMDDPSLGPARLNDIFREVSGGKLSVSSETGRKIRDKIDQLVAERTEF